MSAVPLISAAPNLKTFVNYEYEVDLRGDTAAAKLIAMVGCNKRVLDIGAGSGSITRHLVTTNGCEVVALETNPSSIEKLKAICSRVYSCDLNHSDWREALAGEAKFDVIVAADVLEHLYDPWTVLKAMKSLLTDEGFVVLSLPHVGHCALTACLIQEDFEYREWGLLDKTHIRFFGIHNIQSLYENAGMVIEEAQFVVIRPELTEFSERWSRLPADTRDVLSSNRFGYVYQVVTKAVPIGRAKNSIQLADADVPRPPAPKHRSLAKRISRALRGKK